jgi:hypothetical protein
LDRFVIGSNLSVMHSGKAYHDFMLASTRDRKVRQRFQREALRLLPSQAKIFDFGAGTGIDAKAYAAHGHCVFVHEPAESMWTHFACYCREELAEGRIIRSELTTTPPVHLVTANFAVLNLIANRRELFEQFARVAAPGGYVLASLLNPYFLGDAKYRWWRKNLDNLMRSGEYTVSGENGPICRFTPAVVARDAAPTFRIAGVDPKLAGLPIRRYVFMRFQKA